MAVALSRFDMICGASVARAPDSTETDDSAPRPSVSRTSRSVTRSGARCDCARLVSSSAVLLISAITLTAVIESISLPGASGAAEPALIWMALADSRDTAEISARLSDGIVYLALSSEVKVGVTRKTQVPTRWIDQGAIQAIPIVEVPNRYLAGITEVALKDYFTDKTSWQKMLKNDVSHADLIAERLKIENVLPDEVKPYFLSEPHLYDLNYPVTQYPTKVTSLNLDKTPNYSGTLAGIKGQYLIFSDGTVFNVRSYEGYVVKILFG